MKAYERFLNYAVIPTMSNEESSTCPSTKKQLKLAELLKNELLELGLSDARVDEFGYVYASLPANCESEAVIGFIAHMDTSPAMSGTGVNPRIIENYDGGDIVLNEDLSIVTAVKDFPELKAYSSVISSPNSSALRVVIFMPPDRASTKA